MGPGLVGQMVVPIQVGQSRLPDQATRRTRRFCARSKDHAFPAGASAPPAESRGIKGQGRAAAASLRSHYVDGAIEPSAVRLWSESFQYCQSLE